MDRKKKHRLRSQVVMLCGGSCLAIMGFGSTNASAQSSASPGSPSPTTLGEVVVTANRRAETVQSAPLSITAFSGAELKAQGITSVRQIGTEIPGISERDLGPGQTEYEIRGVSSAGGSSPTVGYYLDDVSLTAPASLTFGHIVVDPNLYDLNRVEVLRGPQGTLYGAGSEGGTIRLITNQPDTHTFSASAQAIGSGTEGAARTEASTPR